MENEESLSDCLYIEVDQENLNIVLPYTIGDSLITYHRIESVRRLRSEGVFVTFYNRDKIIHNYGK